MDYTDPERSDNVELAANVRFVEPNTTVIYACPVIMTQQKEVSLVFVAPKVLDVTVGDILCSPQAGGIMHKIVAEVSDGESCEVVRITMHFRFGKRNIKNALSGVCAYKSSILVVCVSTSCEPRNQQSLP